MTRDRPAHRRERALCAVLVSASIVLASACASRTGPAGPRAAGAQYVTFRNATEDQVRVFVYEAERGWPIGEVQAFHSARLAVPTDLRMRHGVAVTVAAVPVGGRGLTGDPSTGTIFRSETELIEHVTEFRWTLAGHTLAAEPFGRPR